MLKCDTQYSHYNVSIGIITIGVTARLFTNIDKLSGNKLGQLEPIILLSTFKNLLGVCKILTRMHKLRLASSLAKG